MFNSRNLLVGLVAASVSFGVGNDWMAAFAQYSRSERHLSSQEIQYLIDNSQINRVVSAVSSRDFDDRRSEHEITRFNQFVSAWQKADPSIAPFLGVWKANEEQLELYPSTTQGQICVVMEYFAGSREGTKRLLNVGKVSGNKLITDGELGKRIFVKKRGVLQKNRSSVSTSREVEYMGMFGSERGRSYFSAYIFPTSRLRQDEYFIKRLTKLGCTAEFPVIDLNNGQSFSDRHPAQAIVQVFYKRYHSRGGKSEYYILEQNKDKFTSEFYRQLVRALRIDDLYSGRGLHSQPFGGGQAGIFAFQVGSALTSVDRAEVSVTVNVGLRYPGEPNLIKLIVVKNSNKWQIADVVNTTPQIRSLMDSLRRINSNKDFQNVPWEK